MESNIRGITLPAPDHIGAVVKDIDKTVEFLTSVWGMGPWRLGEYAPSKEELIISDSTYKLKLAFADLGNGLELELIEPAEGKSIWHDFLQEKGEGLQHIAYNIKNWDAVIPRLIESGIKMITGGIRGTRWYYCEAGGGLIVQLVEELDTKER